MDATTAAGTVLAELSLDTRTGLPEDLKHLIARFPREVWTSHGNLGEMAKFWLSRHAMFRDLGSALDEASAHFQSDKIGAREYASFFAPRLQFFLQQLHAHHHIEDDHYFPIFRRADLRLVRGFDILDRDHDTLGAGIESTVAAANRFLRALDGPPEELALAAEEYTKSSANLLRGLVRHLDDEEDLIVPLILDRGEDALGVGH